MSLLVAPLREKGVTTGNMTSRCKLHGQAQRLIKYSAVATVVSGRARAAARTVWQGQLTPSAGSALGFCIKTHLGKRQGPLRPGVQEAFKEWAP